MVKTALTVTLVGMGVVFTFLLILVFAMHITAKILSFIGKIFPEPVAEPVKLKVSSSSDEEIAVAIAATKALI